MSSSRPTDETTWAEGGARGGLIKPSAKAHSLSVYAHSQTLIRAQGQVGRVLTGSNRSVLERCLILRLYLSHQVQELLLSWLRVDASKVERELEPSDSPGHVLGLQVRLEEPPNTNLGDWSASLNRDQCLIRAYRDRIVDRLAACYSLLLGNGELSTCVLGMSNGQAELLELGQDLGTLCLIELATRWVAASITKRSG